MFFSEGSLVMSCRWTVMSEHFLAPVFVPFGKTRCLAAGLLFFVLLFQTNINS